MFDLSDIDLIVATATGKAPQVIDVNVIDGDDGDTSTVIQVDPQLSLSCINKVTDVLSLGSSSFIPVELSSFAEFVSNRRPNLLRNNQPYKEGIARYCMPLDSPTGECGWFLITEEDCVPITDNPELEEAFGPEFYGGAVPSVAGGDGYTDDGLLEINARLIKSLASEYLFSIKDKLTANWSVNKVFTLDYTQYGNPLTMRLIHIGEDGSLTAHCVDQAATQHVKPKDLYPVVESWCRMNKVQWDIYRSRFMVQGKPVVDRKLPSLISAVCHEMGINFKTSDFKQILIGLAMENEYNSLVDRYTQLEKKEELKLLEPYDHTQLATDFLKIKDDPEHERFANAVLKHMLEKMVIRALFPGFPHRSTPILHGAQNGGKSGFLKALCGEEHFDEIQSLSKGASDHSGAGHPDTQKKLTQNNCVVINEIGRVFQDLEDNSLKDFITGESASYVEKYETDLTKRGRTSVVVGTTNTLHILRDLTGNTRYQIIRCGMTQDDPIDWKRLETAQQGILLSALKSVRELAKEGIGALKGHTLPDWVMKYSEEQNLNYLAGSEFVGMLSPLVYPTLDGAIGKRTTIGMREIAAELSLKSSEIKGARGEIDRAMKHLGFVEYPKKVRFNGSTAQTVFIRESMKQPKTKEEPRDVMVTVEREELF